LWSKSIANSSAIDNEPDA